MVYFPGHTGLVHDCAILCGDVNTVLLYREGRHPIQGFPKRTTMGLWALLGGKVVGMSPLELLVLEVGGRLQPPGEVEEGL